MLMDRSDCDLILPEKTGAEQDKPRARHKVKPRWKEPTACFSASGWLVSDQVHEFW
jgi:hypothetical protein